VEPEILRIKCDDGRTGEHEYSVRILHEFGKGFLTPAKISQIWRRIKDYPVLFSDYTQGSAEAFLAVLFNPSSVWLEIIRLGDEDELIGVVYISRVIPRYDAMGHFAVWDGIASGRQKIFHYIMGWIFEKYELHRLSAEVPVYQKGVCRFAERHLAMKREGVRREGILHKGEWRDMLQFGLLKGELDELMLEYVEDVQSLNAYAGVTDG
jgi:RimJ/RimL family protein N-acetyltransferase